MAQQNQEPNRNDMVWAALGHFNLLPQPRREDELRRIFETITDVTRRTVALPTNETRAILRMAQRVYADGDDQVQTAAFQFVRTLITQFATQQSPSFERHRMPTFSMLLSFYFGTIFSTARQQAHCNEAARHIGECLNNPALEVPVTDALMGDWLAAARVDRCNETAIEILLRVNSRKILHAVEAPEENLTDGTVSFLDHVIATHRSPRIVEAVCDVLNTFMGRRPLTFALVSRTRFINDILTFVAVQGPRTCWPQYSTFIRKVFQSADHRLKQHLDQHGVFTIMQRILTNPSNNAPAEVFEESFRAVEFACDPTTPDFINSVVDNDLMERALKYLTRQEPIRGAAMGALNRFLETASVGQMRSAATQAMLKRLLKLMWSTDSILFANGLRWLFIMIDKMRAEGGPVDFIALRNGLRQAARGLAPRLTNVRLSPSLQQATEILSARLEEDPLLEPLPHLAEERSRDRESMLNLPSSDLRTTHTMPAREYFGSYFR